MTPIIEVRKLVKHYPKVKAVNEVSFSITRGRCFGLLGPNGAGKTTTIEMMEGIIAPTGGEILYRGSKVDAHYRERIGIQFQSTSLPDFLTVREVITMFSSFYKKPLSLEELSQSCALGEYLDRYANKLSGGQRQRLLLALALLGDPDLLFLDEPTTGLDPQARRNFWDLIRQIKAKDKTIILTTHYMEEAHLLCDEIAIMDAGRILTQGTPNELLRRHFEGLTIRLAAESVAPEIAGEVEKKLGVSISRGAEFIELRTAKVNETLQLLLASNVSLVGLEVRPPTLEDLFLELTGRALRN